MPLRHNGSMTLAPAGSARFPLIDALRGAALVAMVVYHFGWDLTFYGLIATDVTRDPAWRTFARMIAGSFLFLVGISLVLATRNGFNRRAYLRRLALIVLAAAGITLASWLAFPDAYIFFGILHHIALASVLALPFLAVPVWLTAGVALAVAVLPFVFTSPVFSFPLLLWTGLAPVPPVTNDYVPLFPWFACVLAGVAAARALLPGLVESRIGNWQPAGAAGQALVWGGRRSLPIYLIHQPVLLALLWLPAQLVTPAPLDGARFMAPCTESCMMTGNSAEVCTDFCECARTRLEEEGLWGRALAHRPSEADITRMQEATAICRIRPAQP